MLAFQTAQTVYDLRIFHPHFFRILIINNTFMLFSILRFRLGCSNTVWSFDRSVGALRNTGGIPMVHEVGVCSRYRMEG